MWRVTLSLLLVGVLGSVPVWAQDPGTAPFTGGEVTEITVTGIADVDSLRFDAVNLDILLNRGAANRLELGDGDSFRLVNGTFQFGGGDGVAVTEDGDGAITFTGEGDGNDESLTWNYDDTANTVVISSGSGVTNLTYTSIGATFGAALSVSSGVVTISDTSAGALDVGGGLNIGTGNVALVGTDGKLSGPLSSTIIDDLSGANLTTLNASNLSSGTVATARLGSGTASSSTFLRGDSSWQAITSTPAGSDTYVQYNDGGAMGGDSGFTFNETTNAVTITGTAANALDVGGGLNIGTTNAALVTTEGKITAISSTYFADLSGANLTSLDAGNISAGTLAVGRGGTGATSLTDGGMLFGSGSGAVTALGVATNGQIPIGDGSTDPVLATLTGTSNEVDITNGGGSITIGIPASATITTALTISGTGASSLDIGGGLNAGSGNVALVGTDGKINGPLSSTIIDDLSAANLTSIPAGQLTGTVINARLPTNVDLGGTLDVTAATTLDSTLAIVGAVTFNDAGGDVDLRAEGDSNANLFVLDASVDRVGIGILEPANILHVVQAADWGVFLDSSSTSYAPGVQFRPNGTAKGWVSATNAGALLLDGNSIVVVNEGSADRDFRVESDDNANMLFVDGGEDRVGIGTGTPQADLHIDNPNAAPVLITRINTGGAFTDGSDLGYLRWGGQDSDSNLEPNAANFTADVAGTWTSSSHPTEIQINTIATSSVDLTQRMVIGYNGGPNVGIGTATPAAMLDVRVLGATAGSGLCVSDVDLTFTMTGFLPQNCAIYATAYPATNGAGTIYGVNDDGTATTEWGLGLIGAISATDPADTMPAVAIQGMKSPASGVGQAHLADAETILGVYNGVQGTLRFSVKGNGNVGIGLAAPSSNLDVRVVGADPIGGGLCISEADLTHGMTDFAPANCALFATVPTTEDGGASIYGINELGSNQHQWGLGLFGGIDNTNPTDDMGAINMAGFMQAASGTGMQKLGNTDTLLEIRNGIPGASQAGKVFEIRGAGSVTVGGDRNGLVGVSELYIKNFEDLYQTLDDDASVQLSINTAALIMVETNVGYGGCLFFATYQSTTVIELADPGNQCTPTDTDGGLSVFKGNTTDALYVKSRFGNDSTRVAIQVIHGRGQ